MLEALGLHAASAATARALAEALVVLLTSRGGAGRKKGRSKLDEPGVARALRALAALWGRCTEDPQQAELLDEATMSRWLRDSVTVCVCVCACVWVWVWVCRCAHPCVCASHMSRDVSSSSSQCFHLYHAADSAFQLAHLPARLPTRLPATAWLILPAPLPPLTQVLRGAVLPGHPSDPA